MTERTCRELGGFDPDIRHRTNDSVTSLALVARGQAVTLLPVLVGLDQRSTRASRCERSPGARCTARSSRRRAPGRHAALGPGPPGGDSRRGRQPRVARGASPDGGLNAGVGSRVAFDGKPLEEVLVTERELWQDGPPHELFKEMRSRCPVHWTPRSPNTRRRRASGR